jgi:hypothetical protein
MAKSRVIRGSFCEKSLAPRKQFDSDSFRWKQSGKAWLLVGCPKGKWQPRKERCRVGTKAHKILVKKGYRHCAVGTRRVVKE